MEIFYREKAFHARKKIRKNGFVTSEKYNFYASERGGLEHSPLEHWDGTADSKV